MGRFGIVLGLVWLLPYQTYAQTASNNYCYTQRYNANGTKNGAATWVPCDAGGGLWTLNQAQRAVPITPTNGVKFAPTRALQIGDAAACNIDMQLVNDTAAQLWTGVLPGTLPVQVIDIEATTTTCTKIMGLY